MGFNYIGDKQSLRFPMSDTYELVVTGMKNNEGCVQFRSLHPSLYKLYQYSLADVGTRYLLD